LDGAGELRVLHAPSVTTRTGCTDAPGLGSRPGSAPHVSDLGALNTITSCPEHPGPGHDKTRVPSTRSDRVEGARVLGESRVSGGRLAGSAGPPHRSAGPVPRRSRRSVRP